jgi:hypothetical protein
MSAPASRGCAIIVREAREHDLSAVQVIYAHHVPQGVATFERAWNLRHLSICIPASAT